ncbi:MAG: hypothetical protein M3Y27_07400 [Acidobacteriota bacterium]|nr:hypothetical protein [Acidobacteriota bacterium]
MENKSGLEAPENWPVYADPEGRYSLRHPTDWTVTIENAELTVIKDPGSLAEIAIEYSNRDCAAAESELRQRRLNFYLVREFTRAVGGREAHVFEFRDTISNIKEFRGFLPSEGACCELKWTRPAGSDSERFESTLEAILSTVDFVTHRSQG